MTPEQLKRSRQSLGMTQQDLAERLHTTRTTIARYECGTRRIPGLVDVALAKFRHDAQIPLAGIVAAGTPIEPIEQTELVDVPHTMLTSDRTFALRVKGESMIDHGILPNDLVIIRKQSTARHGQTIVALVNNEATIKQYFPRDHHIELRPANERMSSIIVNSTDDFHIEGVLIGVIRYCD